MSLIRSAEHRNMHMPDSYKYFNDSQIEEMIEPSSSDISSSSIHPDGASSYKLRANSEASMVANQSNFGSVLLENESLDSIEDNSLMRLKLQALERELLDDSGVEEEEEDQEGIYETFQSMEMEIESPKEYSSSDSNISSISTSSIKEITRIPRTPKQLLYECAMAISEGNKKEASLMINYLRQKVSIQGEPSQRIAAYMVEGLAARLAESGKSIYKALKCKEPPSSDRLAAMQILFEVCPCFKFGFIAANNAITEAVKDDMKIHIIDFDINQGSQYINLIQTLASRSSKPSHVRLTGVDDPESVQRSIGGLKIIGQRLEKLAETLGLLFEFQAVSSRTSIVTPSMLNCNHPGEALVVNFAFQLHHMPDESVSIVNERDQLLRLVKSLKPKIVTVVEQDVNTNTAPFLQRFVEAYNYYSAVFESLDVTLPRESQDRMNVERQCLARDIVNTVACEGEDRIERYEVAGKWRARMIMAGFTTSPMSRKVSDEIERLIKMYCDRYKIKEEKGALHFGWEDKNLIVASAWR